MDPYGLSKDELMLLQSYDVADPNYQSPVSLRSIRAKL